MRKLLNSLSDKYYSKRNTIQEARDISNLTVVKLCGSLMANESKRFLSKEEENESIAFKGQVESDDYLNEELAMISNKIKHFI